MKISKVLSIKKNIINETSKLELTNKLEAYNIEKLLNGYTNFIYEKILSPLYEPNNQKLQNNDKILQILKTKICGTIEKISPLIQAKVNKLIEEKMNIKNDYSNFKKMHEKEIIQKSEEINNLKLEIEKKERESKEKELENMNASIFPS